MESNLRAELIKKIIAKRKPKAERIKEEVSILELLKVNLRNLQTFQKKELITNKSPRSVEFSTLYSDIESQKEIYRKLIARFDRPTLNIGVIGLARQGKSTFLKTLSGLDEEVPSREGLPCTSVQSIVTHAPEQEKRARVHFYTEVAFMTKIINPYCTALGYHDFASLQEFRDMSFPPAPSNPRLESIHAHLVNGYHKNLKDYSSRLVSSEKIVEIPSEEIPEYVSQTYDPISKKATSFVHFAVEKVEIFCEFPEVGVERVALVDMPGLGDTRLGDEERMIKALGEDVDVILLVRKPDPDGDLWSKNDIYLYETAYTVLKERLPLDLWSFMVINDTGLNSEMCKTLEATREETPIRVVASLIKNCKKISEANEILEEVLEYLTNKIADLDSQYLSSCLKDVSSLKQRISSEIQGIQLEVESYSDEFSLFSTKSEEFKKKLFNTLEQLRQKIRTDPIKEDVHFRKKIEEAISKCNNSQIVPSHREILDLYTRIGSRKGTSDIFLHQIREHFLTQFHDLESGLKTSLDEKKIFISEMLRQLGLANIAESQGLDFLRCLASKFPVESNIRKGIEFFVEFDFLYRGGMQLMVWKELSKSIDPEYDPQSPLLRNSRIDELSGSIAPAIYDIVVASAAQFGSLSAGAAVPAITQAIKSVIDSSNVPQKMPTALGSSNESMDSIAEIIHAELVERHQAAVNDCRITLQKVTFMPTEVGRSMIEEFIDHLLRAKDAEIDWDQFLYRERAKIWPEFENIQQYQYLKSKGTQLIEDVISVNQSLSIF
jgi:hypothetical protein